MLTHYLDYIRLLNKDLKRKGIYLFDVEKYELENQVAILEEFFYLNELFRSSGGTSYVQSQYKYTPMSYLREKISAEYNDIWNKEFEELTRQPENAGKVECDVERIDDFIKKLGLKIKEPILPLQDEPTLFDQNNSGSAMQFSLSYSPMTFDDEDDSDEEYEDELEVETFGMESFQDSADELGTEYEDDSDEDFDDLDNDIDDSDEDLDNSLEVETVEFEENIDLRGINFLYESDDSLEQDGGIKSDEEDFDDLDMYSEEEEEDFDDSEEDEDNSLDLEKEDISDEEEDDSLELDCSYEEADVLDYSDMEEDEYDEEDEEMDIEVDEEDPFEDFDDDVEELDLDTENYDEDLEEYDEIESDDDSDEDEELDLDAGFDDEEDEIDEEDDDVDLGLDEDDEAEFTDPDDDYEDNDDFSISDYMYSDETEKRKESNATKMPSEKQNVQRGNEINADKLCKTVNAVVSLGTKKLNQKIYGGN